ncbi:uncharacterized protein LOC131638748 [Vicia villosa]|uniref:uncharacterized protein LOC131638748 n=1 Tax=Vicia villosa TaxID=3911 RepID=UPI00273AAFD6|nr:uncharacterized protein LOC131638748 [Vicia villosa]
MARPLERVANITDKKWRWKVAVKLQHKWSVLSNNKENFEMVVWCDIHVIVPHLYRHTFDSVLVVNETYTIANFQVQLTDMLFKPSAHKYLIKFTSGTKVGDRNMHQIQDKSHKVTPLVDIITGKWNKDRLIDVIGVVEEIGYTQSQVGGKKQQFNFPRNNTINCTLWEVYAMQFANFIQQQNDTSIPVVVLIQYAKVKEESGKYPLSVTNTCNVTKLSINDDLELIQQFAKRSRIETSGGETFASLGCSNCIVLFRCVGDFNSAIVVEAVLFPESNKDMNSRFLSAN